MTAAATAARTLWGREPAAIIGAVQALIALAVGFGLDLTSEQTALIVAATSAVLAVVTRSQVTPATDPPQPDPAPIPGTILPEHDPLNAPQDYTPTQGA